MLTYFFGAFYFEPRRCLCPPSCMLMQVKSDSRRKPHIQERLAAVADGSAASSSQPLDEHTRALEKVEEVRKTMDKLVKQVQAVMDSIETYKGCDQLRKQVWAP